MEVLLVLHSETTFRDIFLSYLCACGRLGAYWGNVVAVGLFIYEYEGCRLLCTAHLWIVTLGDSKNRVLLRHLRHICAYERKWLW